MSAPCRTQRHSLNPTGMPGSLLALTVESRHPGPRAAVCANLHGDEGIGIGVVHELSRILPSCLLRGAVRLYPSLNPEGLRAGSRCGHGDADLNRVFPGDARGDAAERIAHCIWHDIMGFGPALVLDLHADSSASIPYTILDRLVTARGPERARRSARLERLARATGLTVVHDYRDGPYRRFRLDRSLSGALFNHGQIEAFTVELGTRRLLDPGAVMDGVRAVTGTLCELGLVAAAAPPHPSRVPGGPWRRDSGPGARRAGVLVPLHEPGTVLPAGSDLAVIRALDGSDLERLVLQDRSVILSLAERAWLGPGESAATIAVPDL
jgi:predicted deacylase